MTDIAKPHFSVQRQRDALCIFGRISDNTKHQHHAMQVVWSAGPQPVHLALQDRAVSGRVVIIEGGIAHQLQLQSGLICLLEAQSAVATALRQRHLSAAQVWSTKAPPDAAVSPQHIQQLLDELANVDALQPATHLDLRIRRVLRWLDELEQQQQLASASLSGALACAKLSQSRFLHLFTEHVGTPWRRYLVWRRALVAIQLAQRGLPLTQAAQEAGYADSAHLSRQFRELFGYAPSVARRRSTLIQAKV